MKPTFKQYLEQLEDSKIQLFNALDNTPEQRIEYSVTSYCRIMVGEALDSNQSIPLKPGHRISVKWLYEDPNTPLPKQIAIFSEKTLEHFEMFPLYWTNSQMNKWLKNNAT
jgi:hypothetical protein